MRFIKVMFYCLFLVLFLVNKVNAQENDKNENKPERKDSDSHLFFGGALWLGFGSYTYVDVNLVLGVQITKRVNLGVSGKYQYYKDKRSIAGDFETSVYGGSVFSQIAIIEDFRNIMKVKGHSGIIAHIEYEFLNTDYNYVFFDEPDNQYDRYWLHNILIGGGYVQQIGPKSKSYIILLWNAYDTGDNPYEYPQLRIGFSIGI